MATNEKSYGKGENNHTRKAAAEKAAADAAAEVERQLAERDARVPWPAAIGAQMRRVWGQPETWDRRPEEFELRKDMRKDRYKFLREMVAFERDELAAQAATAGDPDTPNPDAQAKRLLELIDKILSEVASRTAQRRTG